MFSIQLIHLEHVSAICLEHQMQLIVANYLPFITWILKIIFPYVNPQLLHNLVKQKATSEGAMSKKENTVQTIKNKYLVHEFEPQS